MTFGARAPGAAAICAVFALIFFSSNERCAAAVQRTQLPNGSNVIVRRDLAVPVVAVELWFRTPSVGFRAPVVGLSRYAATAIAASAPRGGISLSDLIKSLGGRLVISAYADAISVAASVPAGSERRVLRALSAAYFTPLLSASAMRSALRDVAIAGAQQQLDPEANLHDALFGQLFTSGPAHYPTLPASAAALSRLSLAQLREFAQRAFRSSNAIVTAAGHAGDDLTANLIGRADERAMEGPVDSLPARAATMTTQAYGEDAIGLAWLGPSIRDTRAATALDFIADYLFRADTGTVARATGRDADESLLSGQFITLHDPGVMLVEIAGKQLDRLQAQVQEQLDRIKQPLPQRAFDEARTAFAYHILSDTETPLAMADNFGWYAVEGDALYAPSDDGAKYLQTLESLDPAFVAQVARQYLGQPTRVHFTAARK